MSNRSYLYSIDFNPSDREKTAEDIVHGLSECPSSIPLAYMVIASANPKLCHSLIWEHDHPIAIVADFDKGRQKLFDFLDAVAKVGAFDKDKLKQEMDKTKSFLNNTKGHSKYVLLEPGEIFDFNDEPHEIQAQNFLQELKNIDQKISGYLTELVQWKTEKEENETKLKIHNNIVFKLLFGIFGSGRKKQIENEMKQAEDGKWFELGIEDWSDVLYFDLNAEEKADDHIDESIFGVENVRKLRSITEIKPGDVLDSNEHFQITLDAWKGFQSRQGYYTSIDSTDESDGLARVSLSCISLSDKFTFGPSQANAINYLVVNQYKIRDAVLQAFLDDYPNQKEIYEEHIPDITSVSQYKELIGLATIHVMEDSKDEFAYLGFELGCVWDEEHGLGAMTHKDTVTKVGAADVSF